MKLFDSLFHRSRASRREAEHRDELEYRMRLAELRRQAELMRKEAERAKAEAYRLETSGEHAAAVSKAAQAASTERAYDMAVRTMLGCESTHAQARTQKAFTELLTGCEAISRSVLGQVDVDAAIQAQARLTQTTAAMEEAQESMAAFQEGFLPIGDTTGREAEGEEALAGIMAAFAPAAEEVPAGPEPAAEAELPGDGLARAEWLSQKRRELAEIA